MTTASPGRDHAARDYSLTGESSVAAQANGLSGALWYTCPIPRKDLKALMKRSDAPAIRDTLLWFAGLAASGLLAAHFWGSWLCVPFFIVYGVLYGSASDSRWHECGHGSAFRTRWLNDAVYYLASFMIFREPTVWRWSHTRHHTDTIIVGRDPEIAVQRPTDFVALLLNFFAIKTTLTGIRKLFLHASGRLTADEATFIPEMERRRVYITAWVFLAIFIMVIVACVTTRSILPAMFIGLPTLYGNFMSVYFGITQHAGLVENVLDHRLNSRTVYMNPMFRFIYWNMNYHVEHHMFPMVPYHALPLLHEAIKADCPPPYASTIAAYREIIPALIRQRRDPGYAVTRPLRGTRPEIEPGAAIVQ